MREELEAYRRDAIGRIEQQQRERAEKLRDLQREQAELEQQELPLTQATLRAQRTLPEGVCPRCWIWDGEQVKLSPMPGDDLVDRFRCGACGTDFEIPA